MKTVLVTGACGVVGTRLVALLVERGWAVRTLDLDTPANRAAARRRRHDSRVYSNFGALDDAELLRAVVDGVAHVIHLAELRPPDTDADQFAGHRINVCATRALLAACAARPSGTHMPPGFIFASSVAVFGGRQPETEPEPEHGYARHADAPAILAAAAADSYGRQKVAAEALVRASGLAHVILRLALTPDLAADAGRPHPWLFEFHPDMRIEFLHPADAALALANALDRLDAGEAVRGRTLLLGGGARNRYRYLDWLNMALAARGLRPLPRTAFGRADYLTDWVATDESEALLCYQRHDYPEWLREQVNDGNDGDAAWPRLLAAVPAPLARRYLLAHSPHHAAASGRRPRLLELRRAWTLARRGLAAARLYLS
jgi:nucleoside-diphosphate-sugar epimerase